MKKEAKTRKILQPEGDRVTATAQHENQFSPPQVKL